MFDVISGLIVCSDGVIPKQIAKLGTRCEVKNFSLTCVQVVTC